MATQTGSSITGVICTYNRYDYLPQAIDSLLAQERDDDFQVIVVDNSPDLDFARQFGRQYDGIPNLRYLVEATPGLSNARNVAVRAAMTDYVAFLDDDAVAKPGWLKALAAAFEELGPQAAMIGGKVLPMWEMPRPDWLDDSLLGYLSVVNWPAFRPRLLEPHEWVVGANITFKKAAIEEAGGFNVALGRIGGGASLLSNEEIDLAERLKRLGYTMGYAPDACADHLIPASRAQKSWFRKRAAWQATSDWMMRPAEASEWVRGSWSEISEFLIGLNMRDRSIRGLFSDSIPNSHLPQQIRAIYALTLFTLSGGQLPR